jgi:hypothetical protein
VILVFNIKMKAAAGSLEKMAVWEFIPYVTE